MHTVSWRIFNLVNTAILCRSTTGQLSFRCQWIRVYRGCAALFGRSHMSRGVSSVGCSLRWKMYCAVCCSCMQRGHRDELLAPIRFRELLRPEQKPDRSCVKVVRSPLVSSTSSSSTSWSFCAKDLVWPPRTALVWPDNSSLKTFWKNKIVKKFAQRTRVV